MSFLGLDPSTRTGWCLLHGDGTYTAGETYFRDRQGMDRALAFSDWLAQFLQANEVDTITIEGYGFANAHTLVPLVEIGTMFRMVARLSEVPYVEIPPTVLKKFCTGTGNAKKEVIIREVFRKWGFEAKTNNEADAFVLAHIGRARAMGAAGGYTKLQLDSLKNLSVSP